MFHDGVYSARGSRELLSFLDQVEVAQNPGGGGMPTLQRLGEGGQVFSSQQSRPHLHRFCVVQRGLQVGLQHITQPADKTMRMPGSKHHMPLLINLLVLEKEKKAAFCMQHT